MGSTAGVPSRSSSLYEPETARSAAAATASGKKTAPSKRTTVPLELQIAHFTPSTFPLVPFLRPEFLPTCRKSWKAIVAQRERIAEYGTDIHGITLFYNEFYERLSKVDAMGLYETILMRNSIGTNKIAAKGAILVRIVDFILKLDGDSPESRAKLKRQGQIHRGLGIHPWQYSVFLEIFVHTLSHRLQHEATSEVLEAWVNVLGYTLQKMLPYAIEGMVLESDAYASFFRLHDVGPSSNTVISSSTSSTKHTNTSNNTNNNTNTNSQIGDQVRSSNTMTKQSTTELLVMTTRTDEDELPAFATIDIASSSASTIATASAAITSAVPIIAEDEMETSPTVDTVTNPSNEANNNIYNTEQEFSSF